jgi:putative DNA primase/helicase
MTDEFSAAILEELMLAAERKGREQRASEQAGPSPLLGATHERPLQLLPPDFEGVSWERLKQSLGPIEWDWPGWMAKGFLTVLAAEPGMGKSLLCLRLAGCLMAGWDWPDGSPFRGERRKVIWCEGEGSQALNLSRAKGWGLPLADFMLPLPNPLTAFRLDDEAHMKALLHFCREPEVGLVVMDSLSSLIVGGPTASGGANLAVQGIPRAMYYLGEAARITKRPILVTHHLRKRTTLDKAGMLDLQRLRGTSKIGQMARVVWTLDAPDTADEAHRRLAVVKNNLMPPPEALGMRIGDEGLSFGEPPQITSTEKVSQLDIAADFLLELLDQGPVPFPQILEAAQKADLPEPTLRRAKKYLNIHSKRLPDQKAWAWYLLKRNE